MHYSYWNKILWLLTSARARWRVDLQMSLNEKTIAYPQIPATHPPLSRSLSLSTPRPYFFPLSEGKEWEELEKKQGPEKAAIWENTLGAEKASVLSKATEHNELYNALQRRRVGPGPYCSVGVGGTCFSAS